MLNGVFAVDVVVQELIELLAANVHAELGVCLPKILVKLSVHWNVLPVCGSSPSKLLPNRESTGNVNVGNTLLAGNISRDARARDYVRVC